jgi:nucleoid DNA-binding protein
MSFVELVEEIASKTGLPKTTISKVLKAFLGSAKTVLKSGESIKLPGFGTFYVTNLASRPLFGGTRMSDGRRTVRFKESRRRTHGEVRSSAG